jgi:trehalose synthase
VSGLLLRDPRDLADFDRLARQILTQPDQAARLGQEARQRVRRHFLVNRHLSQYFRLLEELIR